METNKKIEELQSKLDKLTDDQLSTLENYVRWNNRTIGLLEYAEHIDLNAISKSMYQNIIFGTNNIITEYTPFMEKTRKECIKYILSKISMFAKHNETELYILDDDDDLCMEYYQDITFIADSDTDDILDELTPVSSFDFIIDKIIQIIDDVQLNDYSNVNDNMLEAVFISLVSALGVHDRILFGPEIYEDRKVENTDNMLSVLWWMTIYEPKYSNKLDDPIYTYSRLLLNTCFKDTIDDDIIDIICKFYVCFKHLVGVDKECSHRLVAINSYITQQKYSYVDTITKSMLNIWVMAISNHLNITTFDPSYWHGYCNVPPSVISVLIGGYLLKVYSLSQCLILEHRQPNNIKFSIPRHHGSITSQVLNTDECKFIGIDDIIFDEYFIITLNKSAIENINAGILLNHVVIYTMNYIIANEVDKYVTISNLKNLCQDNLSVIELCTLITDIIGNYYSRIDMPLYNCVDEHGMYRYGRLCQMLTSTNVLDICKILAIIGSINDTYVARKTVSTLFTMRNKLDTTDVRQLFQNRKKFAFECFTQTNVIKGKQTCGIPYARRISDVISDIINQFTHNKILLQQFSDNNQFSVSMEHVTELLKNKDITK